MDILFIGDYSNFHVTLAKKLRQLGHRAVVVSSGSRCMDTERDINLMRMPGKWGALKYICSVFSLLPKMSNFDVVQLINPNFLDLKPAKIRYFFNELRRRNGAVALSLVGNDPFFVKACCDAQMFRYSEFRVGRDLSPFAIANPMVEKNWQTEEMFGFCQHIYDNIDCAISCLYEYQKVGSKYLGEKLEYIGIPIDVEGIKYEPLHIDDKINIAVGIKSEYMSFKGTDRLLNAAKKIEHIHSDKCRVFVLKDLPYTEYMEKLRHSHIVLDQLYSYTPATNALGAMAMGKVVVSGAEPEFYDFVGEKDFKPIINVVPDDDYIFEKLLSLILDKEKLAERGRQSRQFVERHNSSQLVAEKYIQHIGKYM